MKRRTVWLSALGIILLLVVAVGVYYMTGGRTYSADLNALRAEFNKDKGKVRVVLLLSPT